MNFIPATGNGLMNGVVEVTLTNAVAGRDTAAIAHEAVAALPAGLDYDYVMVSEPSTASWGRSLGMAYSPGKLSWYNDQAVVNAYIK